MKSILFIFILFLSLFSSLEAIAQTENVKTSNNVLQINVGSGIHIPGGDLKDRFGYNNSFELGVGILFKDRFKVSLEFDYHFGSNVNEDVLSNLRDSQGNFVTEDNVLIEISLKERIRHYKLGLYYTIPFNSKNPKNGFQVGLSPGYFEHYIKIKDDNVLFPQTNGDNSLGYDRLTGGISISEYIGVTYSSRKNNYNFNAGFEFTQAFTKFKRGWDYSSFSTLDEKRVDILSGFRLSLILPIKLHSSETKSYY